MAVRWCHWMYVLILCHKYVSSSVFENILEDVQPCKTVCDQTYPQHTYPNSKHADCCKRGCRFFSLVEFINDGQNVNATKDACMASCMEAYSQTGDRYACNIGCTNQVPFAMQKQKEDHDKPQTMHLLTPFMYVHNIYNNMMDRMSRIMSVSWSFYLQQDDGKVVVLQSEPEIITEYMDMDEVDYEKNKEDSSDSLDESVKTEESEDSLQLEKTSLEQKGHSLPDMYHYRLSQDILPSGNSNSYSDELAPADWLGCIARKSGLPRWLIGLTILASAMAMIWLCFTTTVTAPDHHIKQQKLALFRDLEYLRAWDPQEKVPIQPEDPNEAAPLPIKIHIQPV